MYLKKINLKNKYALVTGAGKGLGPTADGSAATCGSAAGVAGAANRGNGAGGDGAAGGSGIVVIRYKFQ